MTPAWLLSILGARAGAPVEKVAAALAPQLRRPAEEILPALRLRKPIEVRISDVPLQAARALKERADAAGADSFLESLAPLPAAAADSPERFDTVKLRPFASAWTGLLLNAPEAWQDVSHENFQIRHTGTKSYFTASRNPTRGYGLQVWAEIRFGAVKEAFPAFERMGSPYRLDTAAGVAIAADFRGRVEGDAEDTHQLVVCLAPEGSLVSLNVSTTPADFEKHGALYCWLIRSQLKLLEGAVAPDLAAMASSHPQAQYDQGRQLAMADKFKEAAEWFRKAADQGLAIAQYDLGLFYLKGNGLAQSDAQALRWWRKAAEQGHANAQMNVAGLIEAGRGAKADVAEAFRLKMQAAEGGNADAQYRVAIHYLKGNGVDRNPEQCAQWALRSARQGFPDAEYVLGLLYEAGEGVSQDVEQAKSWFRRAAARGKADAQEKLRQLGG